MLSQLRAFDAVYPITPGGRCISLPAQRARRRPLVHALQLDGLRLDRALPVRHQEAVRLHGAGAPDRVGRRAADLGEAEGRARRDAGGRAGPGTPRRLAARPRTRPRARPRPPRRRRARRTRAPLARGRRKAVPADSRRARGRPGRGLRGGLCTDAAPHPRLLRRDRHRDRRDVGPDGMLVQRGHQPAGRHQARHRRQAASGPRGAPRRGRRDPAARARRDEGLPQRTGEDRRSRRRRRLAAHGRRRLDRRGRLHPHHRPQEGTDHQLGRQEHVAGRDRIRDQGRLVADRPGGRDRRRAVPTTWR